MPRQCGDCTLCCKLLPVRGLGKGAGERCKHQRHTGCRVYRKPGMPSECALWNCRWLADDAGGTSRPDRTHVVIDVMPDFITARDDQTGETFNVEVIQCWIDPRYPDAHRDPSFRDYVEAEAREHGRAALIRYNAKEAFVLFAPSLTGGQWVEKIDSVREQQHTFQEIARALS